MSDWKDAFKQQPDVGDLIYIAGRYCSHPDLREPVKVERVDDVVFDVITDSGDGYLCFPLVERWKYA